MTELQEAQAAVALSERTDRTPDAFIRRLPGRLVRSNTFWRVLVVIATLALWQLVSTALHEEFFISTPDAIGRKLVTWARSGYLARQTSGTLEEAALGFVFGAAAGLSTGHILGIWRRGGDIFDPLITALFSIPIIALGPLFILWIGVGMAMKVILAAILVFFFTFWNSFAGVRNVDPDLLNVIRVMGASRLQLVAKVWFPAALPFSFVGLKAGVPQAMLGAVVGELLSSSHGLGYVLLLSSNTADTAAIFAVLVILFVVTVGIGLIASRAESYLFRWREQAR